MFLPNAGLGSWPDSIRGAHGNGCYGAQSDPETTLVWGFAPVTLAQGSTVLSALQGPWPCMPSQSWRESQAGAGGWGRRPPGPSVQEVTGESTTGKEAGGSAPRGRVLRCSGRGGGASKPRAEHAGRDDGQGQAWQRRLGTGSRGPKACWEKTGCGAG